MQIPALAKFALAAFLFPQTAQPNTYSIQGTVNFEGDFFNGSTTVVLNSLNAGPVDEVLTDLSGNFTFGNVPEGAYYVSVRQEGFEELRRRVEVPVASQNVMIFLSRKQNIPPQPPAFSLGGEFQVDIRQLSIPEKALREYQKGLQKDEQGKTEDAIESFRRASTIAPNFIEAFYHLGLTLDRLGRLDDAEKTFAQALMVAPRQTQIRLMLANILVKERKYPEALEEIDRYLKESPRNADRASIEIVRSQLIRAIKRSRPPVSRR